MNCATLSDCGKKLERPGEQCHGSEEHMREDSDFVRFVGRLHRWCDGRSGRKHRVGINGVASNPDAQNSNQPKRCVFHFYLDV
jgi:hypothetical protein